MQPLNPFLRGFFRSSLPATHCQPISHHILLVPTTECLLNAKDRETNTSFAELASSEDFLASHVLRVPGGVPPGTIAGKETNVRESKGKAKQYSTINGKVVVVKDTFVYSNKGFKNLAQAQLLQDGLFYPDAADGQQWLVYYISRPLVGIFQATPIMPAVISDEPSKERKRSLAEAAGRPSLDEKPTGKDPSSFRELLNSYPMISRQMERGLEITIREFIVANDRPLREPTPRSRRSSISSSKSTPSLTGDVSSLKSLSDSSTIHPTAIELDPEEEALKNSLEKAVRSAIDLFQKVDQQQLSMLGANTTLTGPVVERLIERYIAEQVHDQTLWPRICATRKSDDAHLESKIRKMADVDLAQVGIPIEGGLKGRREMTLRLSKGVGAFRKMGVASSPREMLGVLLNTQMVISTSEILIGASQAMPQKLDSVLTINADLLVSMLLLVVVRSGVQHLHARLLYMRCFIFTDDVESGEHGYALATLEAVLTHLAAEATTLRKASKRNRSLWQAIRNGDTQSVEATLESAPFQEDRYAISESPTGIEQDSTEDDVSFEDPRQLSEDGTETPRGGGDFAAVGGSLEHVFPFERPPTPPPDPPRTTGKKRVSMAALPRSQSVSSTVSDDHSRRRTKSADSGMSTITEGDTTAEKMAQTQDADGNSLLMMAVDSGQLNVLRLLLALPAHFRRDFILEDVNNDGSTLLIAAIQSGNRKVTDEFLVWLEVHCPAEELEAYLAKQDAQGRCMAHYLFNEPHLIERFGKKLPWRLKDKNGQTPLFALCRSYDHEQYHSMVDAAIALAREQQGDGEPLHLDDHVDSKGNTLLHVVNDMSLALKLLRLCDADVNAANDKRFTPLMVGSKYGRLDLVRTLFTDPRTDPTTRDLRGLTAVELAKDDDVRNRFDDLVLLMTPANKDGRVTAIVRSFFVEDATVRLVLKSGKFNDNGTVTVTTCRRGVVDFENLAKWLNIECPGSWLPLQFNLPSPFLIPSRPSRAIQRDIQLRLDNFFRNLLTHATFATHELVWEFFLVPDIDSAMLSERSKRKAEARVENVKDEFEPVKDTQEVENFVAFAKDQVKGVTHAVKKTIRSTNCQRMLNNDFHEALKLCSVGMSTLLFVPQPHLTAVERFAKCYAPTEASSLAGFYYNLHSINSSSTALQVALNRPAYLIGSMHQSQRSIARAEETLSRSNRWTPDISIFADAKKAAAHDARDKATKARRELDNLGCELRYTQQTVASELAGWQDEHVRVGMAMLKRLARETVVKERARLDGMKRALREIRKTSL